MQNFSFSRPLVWVLIGLLGFLLLPSKALDYGLFDSTSDELLAAMGWASLNITWAWFFTAFGIFIAKFDRL